MFEAQSLWQISELFVLLTGQREPKLISEGANLDLRRCKNWFKKEQNAWLGLHNARLECAVLFGPLFSLNMTLKSSTLR